MQLLLGFKLFQKQCDRYLKVDYPIEPLSQHSNLFLQLKSASNRKYLLKQMTKKTNNGFKIMRRLTIAHILLIFSNDFYDFVQEFIQQPYESSEPWLNEQCIRTYYHFLKKIVASSEMYILTKQCSNKYVSFQSIFYLTNLITDMFKIVAKMPLLGRYFKQSGDIVTSNFVEVIAIQAQRIYTVFKNNLFQILSNSRNFLKTRQDQKVVKAILQQSLIFINQQMKKLFLDKYYYPYGKGIGVKLFKHDQQPANIQKLINGIISQHQQTDRNQAQAQLQNQLFTVDGGVNMQFYERTLKPVEEKNQQVTLKELQEIQQDELENIQTIFQATQILEEKAQKQTSHHMQYCHDV